MSVFVRASTAQRRGDGRSTARKKTAKEMTQRSEVNAYGRASRPYPVVHVGEDEECRGEQLRPPPRRLHGNCGSARRGEDRRYLTTSTALPRTRASSVAVACAGAAFVTTRRARALVRSVPESRQGSWTPPTGAAGSRRCVFRNFSTWPSFGG